MNITKDHIVFTSAQAINEICTPLKNHLGIPCFGYNKIFSDGAEIDLGTRPELIQYYREKALHQYSVYGAHPESYQPGFILWSRIKAHPFILKFRNRFQIQDGLTLINRMGDAVEFFHFEMMHEDQSKMAFYLNNIDLLENFTRYFKHQAAKLITLSEKNKFYITCGFSSAPNSLYKDEALRENFLNAIAIAPQYKSLTLRQSQCLYYLVNGMTFKEIGHIMKLSPRTVEHHLENIKAKLNCNSRSALISTALKLDVIKDQL